MAVRTVTRAAALARVAGPPAAGALAVVASLCLFGLFAAPLAPSLAGWAILFALGAALPIALAAVPLAALFDRLLPAVRALPELARGRGDPAAAHRSLVAAATLVVLEAGAAVAAAHWARHHAPRPAVALATAGLFGAALVGALTAAFLRRRRVGSRAAAAWLLLPALAPAVLGLGLPDHVRAHPDVPWVLAAAATVPYAGAFGRLVPRRAAVVTVAFSLLGFVLLATPAHHDRALLAALEGAHRPFAQLVRAGRVATDFDGDGSSAGFGGLDCAPWDPRRAPSRTELAGNGVDENCLLGDLADDRERTIAPTGPGAVAVGEPPNVLVLSVDALRPDRMSIYGYERPTTPGLQRWFSDAIRFERAYAESSSTRDTLPSLLTGRTRSELTWHRHRAVVLDPGTRTLAHRLGERGFFTAAVLPFVAVNMIGGTDLGFSDLRIYDGDPTETAAIVNRRLRQALDSAGPRRFFALAHYYEPHEPYRRHRRFAAVSTDPYDQEVAAVDAAIDDLLGGLERAGTLDRTIVAVLSDHGEAFGEHGHRFHNAGVYEEDLRVPLLLRVPGVEGATVDAPVSTTALCATLLDLLGEGPPDRMLPTVASLWPLVRGERPASPVESVSRADLDGERFAIVDGSHKVVFDRALSAVEVYDLGRDPGETRNLLSSGEPAVALLLGRAETFLEQVLGGSSSREFRARQHERLPAEATPLDLAVGDAKILGARAELSRPVDEVGVPVRVLVHVYFRASVTFDYELALLDGGTTAQSLAGPVLHGELDPGQAAPGAVIEDVRTFKVYVEDADQQLVLRAGGTEVPLGTVREL